MPSPAVWLWGRPGGAKILSRSGDGYRRWLAELKQRVERTRLRAVTSANRELMALYWQIGREILDRPQRQGWGAGVVDRLARDQKAAFPDMRGFSLRDLKYMRSLAQVWPDAEFVQQPAAQLPWFHLCILLIETAAYASRQRRGEFQGNFTPAAVRSRSGCAEGPVHFRLSRPTEGAQERDIERALTRHITRFLLELGAGFAFVARPRRGGRVAYDATSNRVHRKGAVSESANSYA
ncbi:PDDEXK nuclease domain-containing protein [Caballeronia udeis]|uniref:PDDEXK nuclease domain-containing protein n=1 Tax=Caballeronia udeis TaxID=1232866 RepID=UPI00094FD97F|nr:PDDEXK nuclease domain-containing protein [Caballeronia udeis]